MTDVMADEREIDDRARRAAIGLQRACERRSQATAGLHRVSPSRGSRPWRVPTAIVATAALVLAGLLVVNRGDGTPGAVNADGVPYWLIDPAPAGLTLVVDPAGGDGAVVRDALFGSPDDPVKAPIIDVAYVDRSGGDPFGPGLTNVVERSAGGRTIVLGDQPARPQVRTARTRIGDRWVTLEAANADDDWIVAFAVNVELDRQGTPDVAPSRLPRGTQRLGISFDTAPSSAARPRPAGVEWRQADLGGLSGRAAVGLWHARGSLANMLASDTLGGVRGWAPTTVNGRPAWIGHNRLSVTGGLNDSFDVVVWAIGGEGVLSLMVESTRDALALAASARPARPDEIKGDSGLETTTAVTGFPEATTEAPVVPQPPTSPAPIDVAGEPAVAGGTVVEVPLRRTEHTADEFALDIDAPGAPEVQVIVAVAGGGVSIRARSPHTSSSDVGALDALAPIVLTNYGSPDSDADIWFASVTDPRADRLEVVTRDGTRYRAGFTSTTGHPEVRFAAVATAGGTTVRSRVLASDGSVLLET